MARASDPNSADSQFFIMFAPAPSLDGQYTVWGKVTSGHGACRRRSRRATRAATARSTNPDKIVKMQVAADVKE